MNEPDPSLSRRFFCYIGDKIEGPFDLLELAGQLKYSNISGDTLICREGTEDWFAFREADEFLIAQGISVETIARHLHKKEGAAGPSLGIGKSLLSSWSIFVISILILCGAIWALCLSDTPATTAVSDSVPAPAPKLPTFNFPQQYRFETTSIVAGRFKTNSETFFDHGKRRTEVDLHGTELVVIVRPDLGRVFSLHSTDKTVTQRIYHPEVNRCDVTTPDAKFQPDGVEVVDGIECTRYRVNASGRIWLFWVDPTRQAPIHLVAPPNLLVLDYKNYLAAPQDPGLFELPKDYRLLPLTEE